MRLSPLTPYNVKDPVVGSVMSFTDTEAESDRVARFDSQLSSPTSLPPNASTRPQLPRAFTEYDNRAALSTPRSRSSSVWTAPSPSYAFRSHSPTLPPLPRFVDQDLHYPSLQSPPEHHGSDNSAYYTALWGSPYEIPSSSRLNHGRHRHQKTSSTFASDGSPLAAFKSQSLRDPHSSPAQSRRAAKLTSLISESRSSELPRDNVRSAKLVQKPRYGFTQDWLKTHLAHRQNSEKGNWWSDESGPSDTEAPLASELESEPDQGSSWLGIDKEGNRKENLPGQEEAWLSSPTPRKAVSRDCRTSPNHKLRPSDTTIRQQDFENIYRSSRERCTLQPALTQATFRGVTMAPGMAADDDAHIAVDKPLPPAPFARTTSEASTMIANSNVAESPKTEKRPSFSSMTSFQRPKKRILWRGKICVVALPLDDGNNRPNGSTDYLKPQAVSARLAEWQAKGFNTKGFDLAESSQDSKVPDGQSRDIYPDTSEWQKEWQERQFRVNIPDRKAWDDYVAELKEEKLRALGVSFGDNDLPRRKTPVSSSISRQASSQSSMLPPSLPASATGLRGQMEHAFSPPLSASSNPLARSTSMISPASHHHPGRPGISHAAKQSISFHGEYPGPPYGRQQHTPPVSGPFSQQLPFGSLPGSRGVSPLIGGRRPSLHGTMSPVSPMPESTFQGFPGQINSLPQHLRQQQHPSFPQPSHQQIHQPSAIHLNGAELQPVRYSSQPEIASPLPQGHRHNLSETLQKEIDDAEYHLEESLRRQLDDEDKENSKPSDFHGSPPVNGRPRGYTSDLDTNPSAAGSENERRTSRHSSKASVSKLNVNAQEFVFDPTKSFAPSMFPFSGNTNVLATSQAPARRTREMDPNHSSNGSTFTSTLNVAAPAFTPSNIQRLPIPSREFSFSSSVPALKPDAPDFKPRGFGFNASSGSDVSGSEKPQSKIFGNMDFSEMLKPAKKSKAIPIVKPDESIEKDSTDDEFQEDWDGRITQAEGRQKRLRRTDSGGDQVPLFATPSQEVPLQPEVVDECLPQLISKVEDDDPSVEKASEQPEDIVDDSKASEILNSAQSSGEGTKSHKHWKPFELEDSDAIASFNAARPMSVTSDKSEQSKNDVDVEEKDFQTEIVSAKDQDELSDTPSQADKPELLATVGPLEYNADVGTFSSGDERQLPGSAEESVPANVSASLHYLRNASNDSLPLSNASDENGLRRPSSTERPLSNESRLSEGITHVEPSFQEIDAVMKHLNGEESDVPSEPSGLHRSPAMSSPRRLPRTLSPNHLASSESEIHLRAINRQRIPSSSPNRLQQPFQYLPERSYGSSDSAAAELVARNARFSPSYKPPRHSEDDSDIPIHRLNDPGDIPISDWDDVVSSVDNVELRMKTGFFDQRVNDLIGNVVQEQLRPLERNLVTMSETLARMSSRPTSSGRAGGLSAEIENSDADDEDDIDGRVSQARARSPLKERKYEKLKASLLETVAAQQSSAPPTDLSAITQTLEELKSSVQQQKSGALNDIRAVVEETINRQMRGKSAPITSSHESASAEKHQLRIDGLESMLKISEARADDEYRARRLLEDEVAEQRRLLKLAQSEAATQRESAEETERSLRAFHDERQQVLKRSAVAEAAQEDLERTLSELNAKNSAMEDTLEEYRLSSAEWREEIDEAKTENKNLDRTIHALKTELEDGIRGRQALRTKIDRLQEDMTIAARNIARDQSLWRQKDEEQKARYELQAARLEAEARTRERLELEIERLEAQEKEAMKSSFLVEHIQGENARLVDMVNHLKSESQEHQDKAAQYHRELHDSRETTRLDLERLQKAVEVNVESTNQQVKNVRMDLEGVIARLESQLEDARRDIVTAKSRHELMLEEASESKDNALREAAESRDAALQEHYRFHERTLNEMKALHEKSLGAAIEEKQRALDMALEDKRSTEAHLKNRLALTDEKMLHYQDRITHLEERLEIAKSAAQAAIQAAQIAKASPVPAVNSLPLSIAKGSDVPGKISPQALRESILVLQEQLHERESQIEKLQQELGKVDKDAPTKIKDRDLEISWLRELLGVRNDDLQDIITTLSLPTYDRDAVRDAAIRLKANLQMEQQEKERAMAGGQTFPSLSSISNLATSPRALPLAAAAAWGNWRKVQTPFGSLSGIANGSASQTPSKSSPQSFLSGLLTPPSTTLRSTPQPQPQPSALSRTSSGHRPLQSYSTPKKVQVTADGEGEASQLPPPVTPTLLRKASYDMDAQSGHYSLERYVEDDEGSNVGGTVGGAREEEGLFGPRIEA